MRGADLMPLLRGEASLPSRVLYYETYSGAAPPVPGAEKSLTRPLWVGSKEGPDKVMFSVRYQRWERYHVDTDPGEIVNMVKLGDPDFTAASDRVLAWFREWQDQTVVGEIGVMTDEDRAQFRALGYIDSP
jgi:hypothetical protein